MSIQLIKRKRYMYYPLLCLILLCIILWYCSVIDK